VRRGVGDAEHDALDLRRVQVDAADDEHVVAPAADPAHPHRGPAARARRGVQRSEVAGAIPDQRHRLLGHRGEHELAFAVRGEHRAGGGVDDAGPNAGHRQTARHDLAPDRQIVARVGRHRRLAARPARGVDPDHLLARHREHAERVVIAEI
jgi:hypothetical protein